ncbi:hypothetical protein P3T76_010511 [Phytophthora citrophthora]|uniref:Uncharacterized protein n=1 Tax=Phytophthora citrophthora TaxID=4793 RepID=A0AAD9GCF2_9STRA|nr:hypothetical protein P3T76_010511 [Phytophthora citrophthora]
MNRMQMQRLNASPPQCNTSDHNIHDASSLWNTLAERQLKERLRVEQQQLGLKRSCEELVGYSAELHRLFTKFEEIQAETLERVGSCQQQKFWDLVVPSDDVFAEQMLVLAKLYLIVKKQYQDPCRAMSLNSSLSMGRNIPRRDPSVKTGVVFEAQCGVLLPFCLDVAAEAYWKLFKFEHTNEKIISTKSENLDDIFSRSLSIQTNMEDSASTSEARGTYMCQKYVHKGFVVLAWPGVWDISEYGGLKFDGLQIHKRGYVKLRSVPQQGPGEYSTSTVAESKFETIPIFRGNVTEQTQAFYMALSWTFNSLNKVFCRIMSDLLWQEDWKATFGEDRR